MCCIRLPCPTRGLETRGLGTSGRRGTPWQDDYHAPCAYRQGAKNQTVLSIMGDPLFQCHRWDRCTGRGQDHDDRYFWQDLTRSG